MQTFSRNIFFIYVSMELREQMVILQTFVKTFVNAVERQGGGLENIF